MTERKERRADYKTAKRARAAALYLSGDWSIEEIAEELDVAYSRAHTYLLDMNVKLRPPGRPRTKRRR